jgi:alanine racemase
MPVIALSQLSRQPERRGSDHRPQLADLRESGAIEQDADLVAFVYREELYKPDDPEVEGLAELIIAKHRNGETGRIELAFLGETTTFKNLDRQRDLVAPARVLAVIKADAYGHGAPEVSRALEAAGADLLGAALLEEGAEVRRAGVTTPLLILGVPRAAQLPYYRRYRLTPVVSGIDQLAMWLDWLAGAGEGAGSDPEGRYVQPIHLKVDTGMTRLGIAEAELPAALEMVRASPHLELAGLLSHLADADLLDSPRNQDQERRFARAVEALTAAERSRALLHLANSAGALHRPASRHDVVRLGLALYGYDPASDSDGSSAGLDPVMSVRTRTVLVREVPAGTRVSYGGRWTAPRPSRIGVLPVGYADGYAWRLSNRASALVRGRRLPLVGSVSMDMVFVDLTDLREAGEVVEVGEEVVLLGRQGARRSRPPSSPPRPAPSPTSSSACWA